MLNKEQLKISKRLFKYFMERKWEEGYAKTKIVEILNTCDIDVIEKEMCKKGAEYVETFLKSLINSQKRKDENKKSHQAGV